MLNFLNIRDRGLIFKIFLNFFLSKIEPPSPGGGEGVKFTEHTFCSNFSFNIDSCFCKIHSLQKHLYIDPSSRWGFGSPPIVTDEEWIALSICQVLELINCYLLYNFNKRHPSISPSLPYNITFVVDFLISLSLNNIAWHEI